jgi:predicted RNase H-like HicB family nuclease
MKATYSVILQPDPAGGYYVSIPAFENGFTQGDTFEEAIENARDVISLLLEDFAENHAEFPREVGVALAVGLEVELPSIERKETANAA